MIYPFFTIACQFVHRTSYIGCSFPACPLAAFKCPCMHLLYMHRMKWQAVSFFTLIAEFLEERHLEGLNLVPEGVPKCVYSEPKLLLINLYQVYHLNY